MCQHGYYEPLTRRELNVMRRADKLQKENPKLKYREAIKQAEKEIGWG